VISADGVDLDDIFTKCRGLINQKLEEIMWGGFSGQKLKLAINGLSPSDHDTSCNLPRGKQNLKLSRNVVAYNNAAHGVKD
jgi:hypothetical protein